MGIQKDVEGDNIGARNPIYSEYTGLYWLWKNTEADYKGLLHHRRCLSGEPVPIVAKVRGLTRNALYRIYNCLKYRSYTYNEKIVCSSDDEYFGKVDDFLCKLPGLLDKHDVLALKRWRYGYTTVGEAFADVVNRALLKCMREIFEADYVEYRDTFEKSLKSNRLFYATISVMRNDIFDAYCTFLFGFFKKMEGKLIDEQYYIDLVNEKSLYRVFGYMGELLSNTFLRHYAECGGAIKELPLLFNAATKGNENIDFKTMLYK